MLIKHLKQKGFCWLWAGSFIFIFSQLLGLAINSSLLGPGGLSGIKLVLITPFALCSGFAAALTLLKALDSQFLRRFLAADKTAFRLPYPVILLALVLLWLPCYLAFYPGILAYDVPYQWEMYFVTGQMSTHHPIIHTLLMCGLFDLGKQLFGSYNSGVAIYCALQLLSLSAVVSCAIYYTQQLCIPKWLKLCVAVFFAFFPGFPVLGISATKDIFFCGFFLLAIIAGIKATGTQHKGVCCIVFALFLALSMLFRNNAVYAAAATVLVTAIFLLFTRNKKLSLRILTALLAAVLCAELAFAALKNATDAKEGSIAEMLCVPTQQIARVYNYHFEQLSDDELETMLRYFPYNNLGNYRPDIADPVKDYFDLWVEDGSTGEFARLWISLGLRFPFTYIDSFLYNTQPLWYLGDGTLLGIKDCYLEMEFKQVDPSLCQTSLLPGLQNFYIELLQNGRILDIPLLRSLAAPALYFWLLFAAVIMLLARAKHELLFIPLLPLMYLATLLLGPCILPRYCLAAFASVPLIMAWLIHLRNEQA